MNIYMTTNIRLVSGFLPAKGLSYLKPNSESIGLIFFNMGIPYIVKHVLRPLFNPLSCMEADSTPFQENKQIDWLMVDASTIIYKICQRFPVEMLNVDNVNDVVDDLLRYLLNIGQIITSESNYPTIKCLYICFDGKGVGRHKVSIQSKRDQCLARAIFRYNSEVAQMSTVKEDEDEIYSKPRTNVVKPRSGLTWLPRSERSIFINSVCSVLSEKIRSHIRVNATFDFVKFDLPTQESGEADVKIVRACLNLDNFVKSRVVIVTVDSDIFISMASLIRIEQLVVILDSPNIGLNCIYAESLREWLVQNQLNYTILLFYCIFFFGCDFEAKIACGTEIQIKYLINFLRSKSIRSICVEDLVECLSKMSTQRPRANTVCTNYAYRTHCIEPEDNDILIRRVTSLKIRSVKDIIRYYAFGVNLSEKHISMSYEFDKFTYITKNIKYATASSSGCKSSTNRKRLR
jgi:hypothetical protein